MLKFETAFTLQPVTTEDGTHSSSQNVISELILHTVQKPQNQEISIHYKVKV
jgi:hypothetical protein